MKKIGYIDCEDKSKRSSPFSSWFRRKDLFPFRYAISYEFLCFLGKGPCVVVANELNESILFLLVKKDISLILTLILDIVENATKVLKPVGIFALWELCGLELLDLESYFVFDRVNWDEWEVVVDGLNHASHKSLLLLLQTHLF